MSRSIRTARATSIHPAEVRGRFQSLKNAVWTVLIADLRRVAVGHIGGNPAVLIDIPRRHFYLFGNTFNAQDFWLAFFFVTGIGFGLFVLSALLRPAVVRLRLPADRVSRRASSAASKSWIEGSPRTPQGARPRAVDQRRRSTKPRRQVRSSSW